MADETPKKEPTQAEAKFFFSILKNLKSKADIDWEAVAAEQNFKSAEVAKVRFGQVKRKLGISNDGGTNPRSAGPTPTKVAKSAGRSGGKKGKGKAAAAADEPPTPSRVKREEDLNMLRSMDDEEESPSKGSFMFKMEKEQDVKPYVGGLMSEVNPF